MRSLFLSCLVGLLASVAAASPARAQTDSAAVVIPGPDIDERLVPPGTRVRVLDEGGARRGMGRFWYLRSDTLWLITGENESAAVPLIGRERIESTRGHRRELWSTIGTLSGMAIGVLASQLNGSEDGASGSARNTSEAVYAAAGGAVVGGLLGWFLAPQRWNPVERPPPAVLPPPPPATGGAAAGTQP